MCVCVCVCVCTPQTPPDIWRTPPAPFTAHESAPPTHLHYPCASTPHPPARATPATCCACQRPPTRRAASSANISTALARRAPPAAVPSLLPSPGPFALGRDRTVRGRDRTLCGRDGSARRRRHHRWVVQWVMIDTVLLDESHARSMLLEKIESEVGGRHGSLCRRWRARARP